MLITTAVITPLTTTSHLCTLITPLFPQTHLALYGPFVAWLGVANDVDVVQVLLPNLDDHILDIGAINAWLTCAGERRVR